MKKLLLASISMAACTASTPGAPPTVAVAAVPAADASTTAPAPATARAPAPWAPRPKTIGRRTVIEGPLLVHADGTSSLRAAKEVVRVSGLLLRGVRALAIEQCAHCVEPHDPESAPPILGFLDRELNRDVDVDAPARGRGDLPALEEWAYTGTQSRDSWPGALDRGAADVAGCLDLYLDQQGPLHLGCAERPVVAPRGLPRCVAERSGEFGRRAPSACRGAGRCPGYGEGGRARDGAGRLRE
jgi:hypothetical protein